MSAPSLRMPNMLKCLRMVLERAEMFLRRAGRGMSASRHRGIEEKKEKWAPGSRDAHLRLSAALGFFLFFFFFAIAGATLTSAGVALGLTAMSAFLSGCDALAFIDGGGCVLLKLKGAGVSIWARE